MNWQKFDSVLDELNGLREVRGDVADEVVESYLNDLAFRISCLQSELCQVRYQWEKPQLEAMKKK